VKVVLAATTYGTNDVKTFEAMQEKFEARGAMALYTEGAEARYGGRVLAIPQMNDPPFVLRLIQFWDWRHRKLASVGDVSGSVDGGRSGNPKMPPWSDPSLPQIARDSTKWRDDGIRYSVFAELLQ
jgi:hypothetical protein